MKIFAPIRQRSTDWVLQFINIVFLLLLYFLVNGSIVEQQQRDIELPMSREPHSGPPPHRALYIDSVGKLSIGGKNLSLDEVTSLLSRMESGATLTVVADRRLSAAALIATLDQLKQSGQSSFSIITQADVSQ
jgi:biopolymer transport protein ExbD